jgi:hypothetical protein
MTDTTTSLTAQAEGLAAGKAKEGRLEHCPYDEAQTPVLRAIWQNAFITARLYGDE